jgi:hypothetical protein
VINYTRGNLKKLEQIFTDLDYTIRYEKGNFNSGYCLVEMKKIVVINKFYDTEGIINVLLDILSTVLVLEDMLSAVSLKFYKQILRAQELNIEEVTA